MNRQSWTAWVYSAGSRRMENHVLGRPILKSLRRSGPEREVEKQQARGRLRDGPTSQALVRATSMSIVSSSDRSGPSADEHSMRKQGYRSGKGKGKTCEFGWLYILGTHMYVSDVRMHLRAHFLLTGRHCRVLWILELF